MKSARLPSMVGAAIAADAESAIVQADTSANIAANKPRLRERRDSGLQVIGTTSHFHPVPEGRATESLAASPEGGGSDSETTMNSTRDSAAPASLVASIDVIAGFASHDSESTTTSG